MFMVYHAVFLIDFWDNLVSIHYHMSELSSGGFNICDTNSYPILWLQLPTSDQ